MVEKRGTASQYQQRTNVQYQNTGRSTRQYTNQQTGRGNAQQNNQQQTYQQPLGVTANGMPANNVAWHPKPIPPHPMYSIVGIVLAVMIIVLMVGAFVYYGTDMGGVTDDVAAGENGVEGQSDLVNVEDEWPVEIDFEGIVEYDKRVAEIHPPPELDSYTQSQISAIAESSNVTEEIATIAYLERMMILDDLAKDLAVYSGITEAEFETVTRFEEMDYYEKIDPNLNLTFPMKLIKNLTRPTNVFVEGYNESDLRLITGEIINLSVDISKLVLDGSSFSLYTIVYNTEGKIVLNLSHEPVDLDLPIVNLSEVPLVRIPFVFSDVDPVGQYLCDIVVYDYLADSESVQRIPIEHLGRFFIGDVLLAPTFFSDGTPYYLGDYYFEDSDNFLFFTLFGLDNLVSVSDEELYQRNVTVDVDIYNSTGHNVYSEIGMLEDVQNPEVLLYSNLYVVPLNVSLDEGDYVLKVIAHNSVTGTSYDKEYSFSYVVIESDEGDYNYSVNSSAKLIDETEGEIFNESEVA